MGDVNADRYCVGSLLLERVYCGRDSEDIWSEKQKKKILISVQKESCYLKNLLNCPRIRLNRSQSSLQYIFLVIKYWWLLLFEIFLF